MYSRGGADRRSAFASPVVAIQSENESLYCHRSLLDAASPVVREEVQQLGFAKSLHCYDKHRTVHMYIEFLYTGRYTLPPPRTSSHCVPAIPARRQSALYSSELSQPVTQPLKPFSAFQNPNPEDLRPGIEEVRSDMAAIMAHARIAILAQKTGVLDLSQHARENLAECLSTLGSDKCEEIAGDLGELLGLVYEDADLKAGAQIERERLRETVMVYVAWNLDAIMRGRSEVFQKQLQKGGRLVSDLMGLATRRIVFPFPVAAAPAPVAVAAAAPVAAPEPAPVPQVQPEPEPEFAKQVVEEPAPAPLEAPQVVEEPKVVEQPAPVVEEKEAVVEEPKIVEEPKVIEEPKVEKIEKVEETVVEEPEPKVEEVKAKEPKIEAVVVEEPKVKQPLVEVDVNQFLEPESDAEHLPEVVPVELPAPAKKEVETPAPQQIPQPLPTPDPEENEHPLKKESETPLSSDEYNSHPTPPVFARDNWVEDVRNDPISLDKKSNGVTTTWNAEAESIIEVDDDHKRSSSRCDSGFSTSPQPTLPSMTPPPVLTPPTGPRSMTPTAPRSMTSTPGLPPTINGVPIPTGPKNAGKKKKKAKKVPPPFMHNPNTFAFHRPGMPQPQYAGMRY